VAKFFDGSNKNVTYFSIVTKDMYSYLGSRVYVGNQLCGTLGEVDPERMNIEVTC
jgi:hypothetical protein